MSLQLFRPSSHALLSRCFLHTTAAQSLPSEDYYSLLLSQPMPHPTRASIDISRDQWPGASTPSSYNPPSSLPGSNAAALRHPKTEDNRVIFSTPLAGPSARMRGLSRGEKGLARPPEPDNCCMSGCVNCVWDAYREEVEEWAAARQKREASMSGQPVKIRRGLRGSAEEGLKEEPNLGDLDGNGGLTSYEGIDMDDEGGLFEGVPVGIKEFMKQEKRIRERRSTKEA